MLERRRVLISIKEMTLIFLTLFCHQTNKTKVLEYLTISILIYALTDSISAMPHYSLHPSLQGIQDKNGLLIQSSPKSSNTIQRKNGLLCLPRRSNRRWTRCALTGRAICNY